MIAIIGGTGLTDLAGLKITHRQVMYTPYGETSAPLLHGTYDKKPVIFLARHGARHTIPPHKINYRANIWALKESGADTVLAVASVANIHPDMAVGNIVIPHQLIDYTWSREQTFFSDDLAHVTHIDFSEPYCEVLRSYLLTAAKKVKFTVFTEGVYGATQGPRLETAAEIDRMERDGCDIVGMTGMPEAALARELELCYATCAMIANPAAGRSGNKIITMQEVQKNMLAHIDNVRELIAETLKLL